MNYHANEILRAYEELCRAGTATLRAASEVGKRVAAARGEIPDDEFDQFCADYLPFDSRKAIQLEAVSIKYEQMDLLEDLAPGQFLQVMGARADEGEGRAIAGVELKWAKYIQPLNRFYVWLAGRKREVGPPSRWPSVHRKYVKEKLRPAVDLYHELNAALEQ